MTAVLYGMTYATRAASVAPDLCGNIRISLVSMWKQRKYMSVGIRNLVVQQRFDLGEERFLQLWRQSNDQCVHL